MKSIVKAWTGLSLIKRIIIGLIVGIILGLLVPKATGIAIVGTLFVTALKSVAPILVLFLIMSAICLHKKGEKTNMLNIIVLYLVSTFLAGTLAVITSYLFKTKLILGDAAKDIQPPSGLTEVLTQLLNNLVSNPLDAVVNANFLGVLAWAVLLGVALII